MYYTHATLLPRGLVVPIYKSVSCTRWPPHNTKHSLHYSILVTELAEMAIDLNLQETMSLITEKHQGRLIAGAVLLVTTIVSFIKLLLMWSDSRVRSRSRLPPTIPAVPIIGGLIRFMRGPISMIREEYARLGSVFTLNALGYRITFLIGPEVSEHLFNGAESEMSQREVYRFTVAAFGRGVAFDVPYSLRLEQIRIFAEGLRGNKLRGYATLMVCEAEVINTS
jgi:sterol 14alpha-demethylase